MTTSSESPAGTGPRRTVHHHHEADQVHPHADRPCVIEAMPTSPAVGPSSYVGRCATHDSIYGYTNQSFPTEAEAEAMTRCDLGRKWCFTIVHSDNHTLPDVVTLSGLWEYVYDQGMAAYTDDIVPCCRELGLYRLTPDDGENQWLKLTLSRTPGGFLADVSAPHPPKDDCDGHDRTAHDYNLDGTTYLHEVVALR